MKLAVRTIRIVKLFLAFLMEFGRSVLRVSKLVLSPRMTFSPGIFVFPLTLTRDFEITLLANLITLTPGTLSVDVSADRSVLFVHAISAPDRATLIAGIADGFERKVMEVFQ
jgi:multicomponent Na+:H+ antiporter subunit E